MTHWYRVYEAHWNYEPEQKLIVARLPVVRETPKMVVVDYFGKHKHVLKDARKRFAYPTPELAIASYIARKARHIRFLQHQINRASEGHDAALALQRGEAQFDAFTTEGPSHRQVRFPAIRPIL